MPINNIINVTISSYNAGNQGSSAYIGLDGNGLVLKSALDATTTWTLIPSLVPGAETGGFMLYNAAGTGGNQCADRPATPGAGQQITLNDDPTPYGSASYCWTLWPTGTWNLFGKPIQLWAIQDSQRGPCMDADNSGTGDGTWILLYDWNGGDNQQWIITPA